MTLADRIRGGLYGLLIGDALGVPYEFCRPENIPPKPEIEYVPPLSFARTHPGVPPATWSDDGAQTLCLLASLLASDGYNGIDFGQRLEAWYYDGYMAVNGYVFDVGIQTREAILRLSKGFFPHEAGLGNEYSNGNGSLMRVLALALWHEGDDQELIEIAHQQSLITHSHIRAQACCALYSLWAKRTLEEHPEPWMSTCETIRYFYQDKPAYLAELDDPIAPERAPAGTGTGYVVDSLHSARLACNANNFEDVVKEAIQIGNDTDTTACLAGGIAGLRYGYNSIPARWYEGLRGIELVEPLLYSLLRKRNVL